MAVIECIDLTKTYGRRITALHNLTLSINEGTSFGLLGENGAGKSTLVRIIMGFIFPSSGRIAVLGEERVARAHSRIGYVHERPIFEHRFSGRAYLAYLARLSGMWDAQSQVRIDYLFEQVNLAEAANRAIGTYSKGMQQRLAIAQALLTDPELLILDEPTSGLDPRSQWEVRQIIGALRKQGKTLLICSHYLAEVEALCDAVGILRKGHLILSGTVADLLTSRGIVEIALADHLSAAEIVDRFHLSGQVIATEGNLLRIADSAQQAVLASLVAASIPILSLNPINQTLEEVYVHTTQTDDAPKQAIHESTGVTQRGRS
jgi:ABC-2 type transport system ATP-binding protein